MTTLSVNPPYPIFTDVDGDPLDAGYVYIGTANLNPQTNPINVYWDAAQTIPAPQPIRTVGGFPSYNGSPGRLYVNSDYSITVRNRNGSLVYSALSATDRFSDVVIGLDEKYFDDYNDLRAFTGSAVFATVAGRTDQQDGGEGLFVYDATDIVSTDNDCTILVDAAGKRWKRQYSGLLDVRWAGASGDGVTVQTAEVQNAINVASVNGDAVVFQGSGTYIVGTLTPKSNVTLLLNGATIKLANGINERLINGSSVAGSNFAVIGGILDGNKANNTGNLNHSGGCTFEGWDGVVFRAVKQNNVYRAGLVFGTSAKNIVIEDCENNNGGAANGFGRFGYGIELYTSSQITIKNYRVSDMYGFGIHFYGCSDFAADNLYFNNLTYTGTAAIAITWTSANRGRTTNIVCNNVGGDNLEINASKDLLIEDVSITSAGDWGILFGDNGTGNFNERVIMRNVKTTSTAGSFSASLNWMKYCQLINFDFDKTITTTGSGGPANDRNNVLQDGVVAANLPVNLVYYRKFHIKRCNFSNFYVNDFDGVTATFGNPQVTGSFNLSLANAGVTYIDFNAFNTMGVSGQVNGRVRVTSWFNNQQGSYHEFLFLGSNNNTTLNLTAITRVDNATARAMTIAADAANRRISITNGTGNTVQLFWTVELHKADY